MSSPNPNADSGYAFERVGWDLCCEHSSPDAEEGWEVKCIHCGDKYEHMPDDPKPCIERIAMALEAAREAAK
jgi:hypothetical protein